MTRMCITGYDSNGLGLYMKMSIAYLADYCDFVPIVGQWHHQQWAYLKPGQPADEWIVELSGFCGRRQIPSAFVAVSNGEPVGSALLIRHDMDTRKDLSPWLASVFVLPVYRERHIGSALVMRVVDEARALEIPRLYLFTEDAEPFYQRLGWRVFDRTTYFGRNVVIQYYDIAPETGQRIV